MIDKGHRTIGKWQVERSRQEALAKGARILLHRLRVTIYMIYVDVLQNAEADDEGHARALQLKEWTWLMPAHMTIASIWNMSKRSHWQWLEQHFKLHDVAGRLKYSHTVSYCGLVGSATQRLFIEAGLLLESSGYCAVKPRLQVVSHETAHCRQTKAWVAMEVQAVVEKPPLA